MRRSIALLLALAACSGSDATDAGSIDSGFDAGEPDSSFSDAASLDLGSTDAGFLDLGGPDAGEPTGFGFISGACGVLDDELTGTGAAFLENAIDFAMDPYDMGDFDRLTECGREIIRDGNAGGSSVLSEVFSYEVLARCEDAVLLKTETEIVYDQMSKKTDLLVEIDGLKIGVSVTRAVGFPRDDPFPLMQASMLLEDKLSDILLSSAAVAPEDAWAKQILHVIAYADDHAAKLMTAYGQLDPAVTADTVVIVTVSNGDDMFLY